MNIKDGYALQLAIKKGYRVLVISGGTSDAVKIRLQKLGIQDVFLQVENKVEVLEQYRKENNLEWKEILFMGDDIPDFGAMKLAGMACSPADAVPEIKFISAYISPIAGGQGCARDIIEKVMKLRGDWAIDTSVSSK
jgi:3-deoxy-D-manno-octulosonate 8-phosphate phosphatase (KDO 8-P phosphatase)